MDKALLRLEHRQRRKTWDLSQRLEANMIITEKAWNILSHYKSIGLYISTSEEVDTRILVERCFKTHKKVCVPKIVDQKMIFVEIHSLNECQLNPFGILEPISSHPSPDPEIQVIPLLAYNNKGYRLGYGKGYYDQYLAHYQGKTLGLCYKEDYDDRLIESEFDISCQSILSN